VVRQVAAAAERWRAAVPGVLVIAVDGRGGAGKSTIAAAVAAQLPAAQLSAAQLSAAQLSAARQTAALVHTDDFFRPGASGAASPARPLAGYYDWRRLRTEALGPLRAGQPATFRRYDWDRDQLGGPVTVPPGPVVLLEGVLSAAPELAGLVDRTVLVDIPDAERLRRLRARISPADWDEDWLAAELDYFTRVRPPAAFDLIVAGCDPVLAPPGMSAPPGRSAPPA